MSILHVIIFSPLISSIIILFFNSKVKTLSYISCLFTLIISTLSLSSLDYQIASFQFLDKTPLVDSIGLDFFVGADSLSLLLVNLTSLIIFLAIIYSCNNIKKNLKEFIIFILLLQCCINASFLSLNLFLFFIFFEASLVPMYLLIMFWGGENRIYASYKFFIYTLFGSVIFLSCIMFIFSKTSTLNILELYKLESTLTQNEQNLLWMGLFITFAIKVPMFPLHTWLPDAHLQAPTSASVILASILLKIGTFGFIRVLLPLLPQTTLKLSFIPLYASLIAILYASFAAIAQEDMKKMIAYSSIAHMGYATCGIFSLNSIGITGSIMQMLSHGLISGGLFFIVGMLYGRTHSRFVAHYGGAAITMPKLAGLFMIFVLGWIGIPGTSGFISELLSLTGTFRANYSVSAISCFGIFLSTIYGLSLYKSIMLGKIQNPLVKKTHDILLYETIILTILALLILFIGIYPNYILSIIQPSVEMIIRRF